MYLKKPKHFVWYFYSSAPSVQLNIYDVAVLFSVGKGPGDYIVLHGLDHLSS